MIHQRRMWPCRLNPISESESGGIKFVFLLASFLPSNCINRSPIRRCSELPSVLPSLFCPMSSTEWSALTTSWVPTTARVSRSIVTSFAPLSEKYQVSQVYNREKVYVSGTCEEQYGAVRMSNRVCGVRWTWYKEFSSSLIPYWFL
jgi:hypothetical protein